MKNIHVVLVDPYEPGNIGSAARAMANMGISKLRLVNPGNTHSPDCQRMALKAYDLVREARCFTDFNEAVADLNILFGTTSSRGRKTKTSIGTVRETVPVIQRYAGEQSVGILFGPERRGLSDSQIAKCQYLMTIPSSDIFPTLNLAQSVIVVLYEMFQSQVSTTFVQHDLATQAVRDQMFNHMEESLINIGFLSQNNPENIMKSIRRFLGKADLTDRDIKILRGIFSQMDWYVRSGMKLDPDKVKKP